MKPVLIAAGLALCASVAHAQMGPPPGGGMGGMGMRMGRPPTDPDLDHDGKVTFAEFKKMAADRMLGRMDADRDGKISQAEMKTMTDRMGAFGPPDAAARMQQRFAQDDANRDGVLTRAEIEAGSKVRFDEADTNHDGWLSKGELLTMRQNRRGPG